MSFASQAPPAGPHFDERALLHRHRWLFFTLGLVSLFVGLLAISFAIIFTMVKVIVLGVLLMAAGSVEVVHAFMARNGRGFAIHLLAAALYLLVGLFIIEDPDRARAVLTLLLAASFIVGGVLRIMFSLGADFPGWQWVLFNGAIDLLLGILIWSTLPDSSHWVIGLFVGIDLVLHGWSWMALALTFRDTTPSGHGDGLAGPVRGTDAQHIRA
jgi:uncharacterized membrane protein HdeD (DUF308 family)